MNAAELVDVVSTRTGYTKAISKEVIKMAVDTILKEVKKGGRVSLIGFGSFYQVQRKARVARNPQTGAEVKVAAVRVPRFRPGKDFKDAVKTKR